MGRRKVRIYYGMSGSLKGTTIGAKEKCSQIMWSGIKNWKTNRDLLFPWLSKETNLNYALLHLTRLSDYKVGNLVVERGITDMLFYEETKDPEIIQRAVLQEQKILGDDVEIEKILLIMLDKEFIAQKVLQEKTRREWFDGVDDYLRKQTEYLEFTKKFNDITKKVVIENARKYLSELGIEFV
jgi:hypothetical protein